LPSLAQPCLTFYHRQDDYEVNIKPLLALPSLAQPCLTFYHRQDDYEVNIKPLLALPSLALPSLAAPCPTTPNRLTMNKEKVTSPQI